MKIIDLHRLGLTSIKLALATVLVFSGFIHIGNSLLFLSAVVDYDMLRPMVAVLAAALLPFLQVTVAVALITELKKTRWEGLAWTAAIFAAYTCAQGLAYGQALDISCGCFGTSSERIGPRSLAWSIGGLVLSLVGIVLSHFTRTLRRGNAKSAGGVI